MQNLMELIQQIKNRCIIAEYIQPMPNSENLLATLLEDIYEDAQQIIDIYCVVKK